MKFNFYIPKIRYTSDASGAAQAAERGDVVVIVDVIDMSTTLETCIELGAAAVFGASPIVNRTPVKLNPIKIASEAAQKALDLNSPIIIISEPRFGKNEERERFCSHIVDFLKSKGCCIQSIVPNIGKEIKCLVDCKDKVIIAVTASGGAAYDAAFSRGAYVSTATIARTSRSKGQEAALKGCIRALKIARKNHLNISLVAASSNSLEDILAVRYLYDLLQDLKFLQF